MAAPPPAPETRVGPPPSTATILSDWSSRLPSLPPCEWPEETDVESATLRAQYESTDEGHRSGWLNPLRAMFHPNPFDWDGCPDFYGRDRRNPDQGIGPAEPVFETMEPLQTPDPPGVIPKLELAKWKFNHVELMHEGERDWLFKADTDSGDCILKVFYFEAVEHFKWERDAYTRFLTAGASMSGLVPSCVGWFEIDQNTVREMDDAIWLGYIDVTSSAVYPGLMIEYIPGQPLSTRSITVQNATSALYALAGVHRAGVLHNDASPRNFILVPSGRVVLVDFDESFPSPSPQVNRLACWRELSVLWGTLFEGMLPDKKVGINRDYVYNP